MICWQRCGREMCIRDRTFDENFAKATGVNVGRYNIIIAVLTAVTIVLGMRMMGAMLISSPVSYTHLDVYKRQRVQ